MADIIKDDFIKRSDALLAAFDLNLRDCSALLNNGIPYQHIKNALRTIKAIDVQPVVHGKWEEGLCYDYYSKGVLESKCSICGSWNLFDSDGYNCESNFCPNCGADMRGGITDG